MPLRGGQQAFRAGWAHLCRFAGEGVRLVHDEDDWNRSPCMPKPPRPPLRTQRLGDLECLQGTSASAPALEPGPESHAGTSSMGPQSVNVHSSMHERPHPIREHARPQRRTSPCMHGHGGEHNSGCVGRGGCCRAGQQVRRRAAQPAGGSRGSWRPTRGGCRGPWAYGGSGVRRPRRQRAARGGRTPARAATSRRRASPGCVSRSPSCPASPACRRSQPAPHPSLRWDPRPGAAIRGVTASPHAPLRRPPACGHVLAESSRTPVLRLPWSPSASLCRCMRAAVHRASTQQRTTEPPADAAGAQPPALRHWLGAGLAITRLAKG